MLTKGGRVDITIGRVDITISTVDIAIGKDRLQYTVEIWGEVVSLHHVSSPHAAFAANCAGFVDNG